MVTYGSNQDSKNRDKKTEFSSILGSEEIGIDSGLDWEGEAVREREKSRSPLRIVS